MEFLPTATDLGLMSLIIVVAFVIRGIVGFGSGLIAIPFLALFNPLQVAVILIAILDYLASLTHGIHGRQIIQWRLILPMLPLNILGVLLAVYIFHTADFALLIKILGGLIFLYAIYYLGGYKPRQHQNRLWGIPAGLLGSLVGTLFGTGGPFYVIYLQLQGLDKSTFRATFASIFLIDGCLRITSYFMSGLISMQIISLLLVAIPVMFIALYIGEHIHTNISQKKFQRLIGILLLVSSITLLSH